MRAKHPEECDISAGIPQCQYVHLNGHSISDGVLFCELKVGHEAPHQNAYGSQHNPEDWFLAPENLTEQMGKDCVGWMKDTDK